MKKAREIMVPLTKVISVGPDDSLQDATRKLASARVSGAPVVAGPERKVVGVISESDILRFVERTETDLGEKEMVDLEHALPTRVKEVMSKSLVSVGPEAELDEIVRLMTGKKVNRVIVVDRDKSLLGVITRDDVLTAALAE